MFTSILHVLMLSFVVGYLATMGVRRVAPRFGLVDHPDNTRKLHRGGTPLGGGIAIFVTIVAAVAVEAASSDWAVFPWTRANLGLFAAATLILLVGVADDRFKLRGRQKLVGQIIAAGILVATGMTVGHISIFGMPIELGILSVPFCIIWIIGAINAMNLIDGADGMAGTIGTIVSLAIAAVALLTGHPTEAAIAAALAGALMAFLVFNFPPATIFMGDAGSMLVGLILGNLAIRCSLKGPTTVALAAPIALLAVPLLDSFVAILRRVLTGRSIYTTDRGHLHHCLLRLGIGHHRMLLVVAMLCLVTSLGALASVYAHSEWLALFSVAVVVSVLAVGRVFGHAELKLLGHRVLAATESLVPPRRKKRVRQSSVRLQGSRNWDRAWEILTDFARRHDLCYLKLDVNAAWMHEGYHASWVDRDMPPEEEIWTTRVPVATHTRIIGHLEIRGRCRGASSYPILGILGELLESLEYYFTEPAAHEAHSVARDGSSIATPEPELSTSVPSA